MKRILLTILAFILMASTLHAAMLCPESVANYTGGAVWVTLTCTGATADDGADPGSLFLFSTNIYANALTAIFDVNAIEDFSNTTTKSGESIAIPFLKCVNTGTVYYANLYTS